MAEDILKTKNLKIHFSQKGRVIKALDGVDIFLRAGYITSLAGESGCGKTTLAKTVLRFHKPDDGNIYFNNKDITLAENELFLRQNIQIVFQNPFSSVDPRYTVFSTLYEALSVFRKVKRSEAEKIITQALGEVELDDKIKDRFPHQLSGGQIQRVCIARALLNKPSLVILDEPTSSLDITTAAKIIGLLEKLQADLGITFLFISHNLRLLRKISDYCFIMYYGKIVEHGPKNLVYKNPLHPYTRLLIEASYYKLKYLDDVEVSASGCSFRPRCPFKDQICEQEVQQIEAEPGHFVACQLVNHLQQ